MKTTILTSHKLLQEAERRLKAARPATIAETLAGVLELLREQRRFDSVSLHVEIAGNLVQLSRSASVSNSVNAEVATPIRIGGRLIGELRVQSERGELSYADDVLLRRLAKSLARLLTSTGKALVRHAGEAQKETAERKSEHKLQPVSERRPSAQRAAVGAATRR